MSREDALTLEQHLRVIRSRAAQILGGDDAATEWLRTPNGAFGGQAPLELLNTSAGAAQVHDVLAAMEDGAVA